LENNKIGLLQGKNYIEGRPQDDRHHYLSESVNVKNKEEGLYGKHQIEDPAII